MDRPFRTMRRLIELRQPVVNTLGPNASLTDAARLITTSRVEALVILDGDSLVGVLSVGSFARMAAEHPDFKCRDLNAADAMDATTVRADLDTTVPEAMAMMDDNVLDHLPVMADGRIVDLLSRTALLKELVWHYTEVIREMQLREQIMHRQGVYSC